MNMPDYRRAVRTAQMRFETAVREAAEILGKELAAADEQFFEEQAKAVEVDEDYAIARRAR